MTERTARIEIPDRYRYAVIPHIMVHDAAAAIDFYSGRSVPVRTSGSTLRAAAFCTPRSP
ncbi:hypothetical protein [Streptomyces actinomycinicus]|uniref:hypothetical protein n=1 Tax=Streptomyces actinomycinicus TaxID=1695166 RepID=UPI001F3E4135|nr:hypothetical protein [Streptomyces actinomycinicus]